ncbi:sensor histidine kinase [Anaerocolumna sp.]|uniref:sensor histidine kinase n=1 Tax=Anaerocolumna sp. TaxID=2041569 RepID=UPI0028AC25E5|nr:histidine kinase [Anaerocolumna sp.]
MKKKWFIKSFISFAFPIFIVILLFGVFTISFVYHSVLKELNKNNENLLIQIRTNVETILSEVNSLSLNFEFYTKTSEYTDYVDASNSTPEKRMVEQEMLNFMNTLANSRMYVHSIYVYINNPKNSFIVSNEGKVKPEQFLDKKWLEDVRQLEQKDSMTWIRHREISRYSFEKPTSVITAYRKLYIGLKQVGTVALNINASYLDERLSALKLLQGQEISIYSEDGEEIYTFIYGSESGDSNSHNPNIQYITVKSIDNGYSYISRVPMHQLYDFSYRVSQIIAVILLISIFILLFASYIISKRNYERVMAIYRIIEAADASHPLPELPSKVKDEYGYIIQNMIKVFIESRFIKAQLDERKSKYEAMELLALQSQINPHFLFNTLETINWGIVKHLGITNHVSEMLGNLSDVLKYSLSNPNEKVAIKEEIAYARSYLAIQLKRYQEQFEVIWDIDEGLENYYIIKLVIQPLVENSIYHGIKEREGKSKLKITLHSKGTHLCLQVIDTGKGMSKDRLKEINQNLNTDQNDTPGLHIGIKNVYKRLKLVYENQCSLTIKSKEEWGTIVTIILPCDNSSEIENFIPFHKGETNI